MKRAIFLSLLVLSLSGNTALAQYFLPTNTGALGGAYISLGLAPAYGQTIVSGARGGGGKYEETYSGLGYEIDFKAGYAISSKFLVFGMALFSDINGKINDPIELSLPGEAQFQTVMLGGGLAFYQQPWNVFYSLALCSGKATTDPEIAPDATRDAGLAVQAKYGKEWVASPAFNLGLALGMTYQSLSGNTSEMKAIRFSLGIVGTIK